MRACYSPLTSWSVAVKSSMLARARSERGHAAWTLRLLGEIALHHDCPDVATAEMTF